MGLIMITPLAHDLAGVAPLSQRAKRNQAPPPAPAAALIGCEGQLLADILAPQYSGLRVASLKAQNREVSPTSGPQTRAPAQNRTGPIFWPAARL